jgi:8-amino-3,8-dideoxy-alpha-D-manno-octulosonate transaminase
MSNSTTTAELAINGGTPVRTEPWFASFPGGMRYGQEELDLLRRVVEARSPFRFAGPDIQGMADQFEQETAEYLNSKYVVGVTSGTAALKVGLAALQIGPGDEVIVPAATFMASATAVTLMGATPIFAEIDHSLCLDPNRLKEVITPRTKAIMVVHITGVAADMDGIMDVAKEKGLAIIEDCAQSWGATFKGQQVGSMGEIGAFSLQMNKNITAGDGGCIATNDHDLFERSWRYHDHGQIRGCVKDRIEPQQDIFIGENLRMSELTGAVALAQIRKLPAIVADSRANYQNIISELESVDFWPMCSTPDPDGVVGTTLTFFADSAEQAQNIAAAVRAEGVLCKASMNSGAVYMQPQVAAQHHYYATAPSPVVYPAGHCPTTESILARQVYIGTGPNLTEQDVSDAKEALVKVALALRS